MAFIRPYQPSDEEAVLHVFRETASPPLRTHPDPSILHISSFLWCRPYLTLDPSHCFVLDDGTGKATGYILSTPSTPSFVARYRASFLDVALAHGITAPDPSPKLAEDLAVTLRNQVFNPEHMLYPDHPGLVQEYPAHLHIDILPSHTSQGWGPKLIETATDRLRSEGVGGVYLGMDAMNTRAHGFYDRLGFERYAGMRDEETGEVGRMDGAVVRVKRLV